jgi:hypothetical protein
MPYQYVRALALSKTAIPHWTEIVVPLLTETDTVEDKMLPSHCQHGATQREPKTTPTRPLTALDRSPLKSSTTKHTNIHEKARG